MLCEKAYEEGAIMKPRKGNHKPLLFLKNAYHVHKNKIGIIILFLVILSGLNSLLPHLSAVIIDEGFIKEDSELIIKYAIYILLLSTAIGLLYIVIEYVRIKGYNEIQTTLKEKALNKLLHIDYSYFNEKSATEVYQQFDEDILAISGCFSSEILLALVQIFVSIAIIPVLINISWKLTLILLLVIPFDLIKSVLFSKAGYKVSKKRVESKSRYSSWLSDVVSGIGAIRCFGLTSHFYSLFWKRQKDITDAQVKQGMFQETMTRIELFFVDVLTFIIYVIGGYLFVQNEISLGNFVAFQTYSLSILTFIGQFLNVVYGYSTLKPSIERYIAFLEEKDECIGKQDIDFSLRTIKMSNVSYTYNKNEALICDISLQINSGDHIAFWGKNGCGKTTLINLLLRIYHPDSGTIYINDINIDEIIVEKYRRLFTVASQSPFIFCDTVRNNVCLYDTVPEAKLLWALECVGLSDFVNEKNLDYIVGQNGCELSGGQRQRISIARTLVSSAPIVILDEPESNLDSEFSALFKHIVDQCYDGRTVIMITHQRDFAELMDYTYSFVGSSILPSSNSEGLLDESGNN